MRAKYVAVVVAVVCLGSAVYVAEPAPGAVVPSPVVTDPVATGPVVTGPVVTGPVVTGPVTGGTGRPVTSSPVPLGPAGYVEQEYFLRGSATAYAPVGTWGSDGRWDVQPAGQAPFQTRMLVRRPADPARFNGTVVVEWLDLPGGVDIDPDFLYTHDELLRAGYAWVGVSAQQEGVAALRRADPVRYAGLTHPGDPFSYGIYSQAAEALRHPGVVDPLGGLRPKVLIGDGYSGSAARLVTYINAVQPVDGLFAGFLVHSRWARSAPLAATPSPAMVLTRTDRPEPVLTIETETEIRQDHPSFPNLDYSPVTQPDSARFRLWEVPGTAHVDATLDALLAAESGSVPTPCALPANSGQEGAVMSAALARLDRWVRTGVPAPAAPRIRLTPDGAAVARDRHGNALGGVRTPALDAPTATLTGAGNRGASPQCEIEGTTTAFGSEQLTKIYPTHHAYVGATTRAAEAAVSRGFLLPPEAAAIIRAAASRSWPNAGR